MRATASVAPSASGRRMVTRSGRMPISRLCPVAVAAGMMRRRAASGNARRRAGSVLPSEMQAASSAESNGAAADACTGITGFPSSGSVSRFPLSISPESVTLRFPSATVTSASCRLPVRRKSRPPQRDSSPLSNASRAKSHAVGPSAPMPANASGQPARLRRLYSPVMTPPKTSETSRYTPHAGKTDSHRRLPASCPGRKTSAHRHRHIRQSSASAAARPTFTNSAATA